MNQTFVVCIPIYNDWESAAEIARRLQQVAAEKHYTFKIVLVDDGSSQTPSQEEFDQNPAFAGTTILQLRRNLGHQRAIAIGLTYIYDHIPCRAVIVMDGDGEDAPEDTPLMIKALDESHDAKAVFAKRMRRTESLLFRIFYLLFRLIHFTLTGRKVEVGNFSVLPANLLARLVGVSEIWNHYAAAVEKARLPRLLVPISRGRRIRGESKMNFVSLVTHGLSAISVFSDEIGVRLLVVFVSFLGLITLGLLGLLLFEPFARVAFAPWIVTTISSLVVLIVFSILLAVVFILIILQGRNFSTFLPLRDYEYFIHRVLEIGK
jgi:glycosyltransferase involved in cell wall biosynthesis